MSIALKSPVTYRRASASFSRAFAIAKVSFAKRKDLRGFRSGCCIADKVFPCRMLHAADPASTYRQPGWVTSDLCRSGRGGNSVEFQDRIGTPLWLHARTDTCFRETYRSSVSSRLALSLIPTTSSFHCYVTRELPCFLSISNKRILMHIHLRYDVWWIYMHY